MKDSLLLIEDTASLRVVYEAVLGKAGYSVSSAGTAAEGLSDFQTQRPNVVLLDLMLPDRDGLLLMADILREDPDLRVVVITANGSINRAVDAMRAGAFEFLVKPFDEVRLLNAVENAWRANPDTAETADKAPQLRRDGFIGSSSLMREVYTKIETIGRSMATVFISGDSGTGKEVCAKSLHMASPRSRGPFVPLNCGAIPADLLESEVFGHLKGSFTGAIADKMGAAAAADGGTLFLDEICEMDLNLQTKLLRFLQTSTITPVGAVVERKVNVRIICATNRDPYQQVRIGRFREDLFYRLHVVPIKLPTLAARGEDVIEISEQMLAAFAQEEGKSFDRLDDDVKDLFRRLPWPGNVRQLLNVLRNVVVLHDAETVTTAMLPMEILQMAEDGERDQATASEPVRGPVLELSDYNWGNLIGKPLAEIERLVIEATIDRQGGSVTKAARILDVSPSTLYRKRDGWRKG